MPHFFADDKLNVSIQEVIGDSKEFLFIISPFIKLSQKFKSLLNQKKNQGVQTFVVFGKNENSIDKSLSKEDFEFFKEFNFIKVVYNERLLV